MCQVIVIRKDGTVEQQKIRYVRVGGRPRAMTAEEAQQLACLRKLRKQVQVQVQEHALRSTAIWGASGNGLRRSILEQGAIWSIQQDYNSDYNCWKRRCKGPQYNRHQTAS